MHIKKLFLMSVNCKYDALCIEISMCSEKNLGKKLFKKNN